MPATLPALPGRVAVVADQDKRITLHFRQGATFRMAGTVLVEDPDAPPDEPKTKPYPWTGDEAARLVCRPDYDADPVLSLTSDPGGGITLGPEVGRFRVYVPSSRTKTLPGDSYGVFALEVDFPPGEDEVEPDTRRPLDGDYDVDREVAR
jgi:hypothetical protein